MSFALVPEDDIGEDAIDQLLNGVTGLRASYAKSVSYGQMENNKVCQQIATAFLGDLVRCDEDQKQVKLLTEKIGRSLSYSSAKVWFDAVTDKSPAAVLSQEGQVEYSAWQVKSENYPALANRLGLSEQQVAESVAKGRTVPRAKALDVKGAFVLPSGEEYVVLSKKTRSEQIHLFGWT